MKRILFALVLLVSLVWTTPVDAQCCGNGLVRSYPLDHSGAVSPMGAKMWIDFDQTVAGTMTSSDGNYTFTVNGTPTKVTDGTWPSGLSGSQGHGWKFGSGKYLSRSDDGSFEPSGNMSVLAVITPMDTTTTQFVFSKYKPGTNDKEWSLYLSGATPYFLISSDGVNYSQVFIANAITLSRVSCIVATYDSSGGDGSSVGVLYVDSSTATVSTMHAPVANKSTPLTIGVRGNLSSGVFTGTIHHLAYWDRALSADEAKKLCAQYRGTISTSGNLITTTSTSPPAIPLAPPDSGTEPFLMDMPANTNQVGSPASGSGGLYGASAITNFVHRASFETWASSTDVTGWTEGLTAGDGTAAIAQETSEVAHGGNSAKLTLTGTTSSASLTSACLTSGMGADLYVQAYAKGTGTNDLSITVKQWDAADCTTALADIAVTSSVDVGTSWSRQEAKVAAASWDASTSSYQIEITEAGDGGVTTYVDAVQARAASYATDAFCLADTDASAVCTTVISKLENPLSIAGDKHIKFTQRYPYDASELGSKAYILRVGAGGTNTWDIRISETSHDPYVYIYDGAGAVKAISPNVHDVVKSTDYSYEVFNRTNGDMGLYWNSSWIESTSGVGSGIFGGVADYVFVYGHGSASFDIWIRALKFYRRIVK